MKLVLISVTLFILLAAAFALPLPEQRPGGFLPPVETPVLRGTPPAPPPVCWIPPVRARRGVYRICLPPRYGS